MPYLCLGSTGDVETLQPAQLQRELLGDMGKGVKAGTNVLCSSDSWFNLTRDSIPQLSCSNRLGFPRIKDSP